MPSTGTRTERTVFPTVRYKVRPSDCRLWEPCKPDRDRSIVCIRHLHKPDPVCSEQIADMNLAVLPKPRIRGMFLHGDNETRRLLLRHLPADVVPFALFHTRNTFVFKHAWKEWVTGRHDWDPNETAGQPVQVYVSEALTHPNSHVRDAALRTGLIDWEVLRKGFLTPDILSTGLLPEYIRMSKTAVPRWVFKHLTSLNAPDWESVKQAFKRPECEEFFYYHFLNQASYRKYALAWAHCPAEDLRVYTIQWPTIGTHTLNLVVVEHPKTSTETLTQMFAEYQTHGSGSERQHIYLLLAGHPNVSSELLLKLCTAGDDNVRAAVVRNRATATGIRAFAQL